MALGSAKQAKPQGRPRRAQIHATSVRYMRQRAGALVNPRVLNLRGCAKSEPQGRPRRATERCYKRPPKADKDT
eukprot:246045-Alexandrium_andersonii.AAC.1